MPDFFSPHRDLTIADIVSLTGAKPRPDTPLPWLNYLGQDDLFGLCTNTGGGYTFWRDARLRRLTRYRYNDAPLDSVGRYLYVRDGDTVWNPGWKPAKTPLDRYECRHGLGYTRIRGARDDVEVELCFFVPPGDDVELWAATVRNTGATTKQLRLFSYVEFALSFLRSPRQILTELNESFSALGVDDSFVTAACVKLDKSTRRLTVANAGHVLPLVRRASGAVMPLGRASGPPVGMLPAQSYADDVFPLDVGDIVLLMTDGVLDALHRDDDQLGLWSIIDLLAKAPRDLDEINRRIVSLVQQRTGGSSPDDLTLLGLEVRD